LINFSDDLFAGFIDAALSHHKLAIVWYINLEEEVRQIGLVIEEDQPSRISHCDPRRDLLHFDK